MENQEAQSGEDPREFFKKLYFKGASPEHGQQFGASEIFDAPIVADLFVENGKPESVSEYRWDDLTTRWVLGQLSKDELQIMEDLFTDFVDRTHTPLHNPNDGAFSVSK
ncbi:MAG: hypothetical protein HZA95_00555 [Candidatus Vogelbacteria bacterium]|nr:hypothetical protein [Candidatus Vogelbacteria bacterium]